MNFTFMIDNCLSSCQITYNGLTILDYSKSAIEHFVKKRMKNPENKYDVYHLFSSNSSISTWIHDTGHFLQKLKTVQPQFENTFNLEDCFHNLNKFRTLNGTDNLFGGRDVLKIETGIVFVFTNREYTGTSFSQLIRWDYRMLVFLLQPPGVEDTSPICIQTNWHQIAATVGQGLCFEIQDYNMLFSILDDPKLTPPQISISLSMMGPPHTTIRYDEFQSIIEKTKIESLPPQSTWLTRSIQKINFTFATQRHKCQPNMTIFTKVYLPEQYPLNDFTNYPSYPEYYVDFSISFHAKMPNQIPYQEVLIENPQLLKFVQGITTGKNKTLQFPLIYFDKREEPAVQYLIGLFLYNNSQQMELRFYFPNFQIYYDLLNQSGGKDGTRRFSEQRFFQYISQIPNYYAPCIKKNLSELQIQTSRSLQFIVDEQNLAFYMQKVKAFQAKIQKIKKNIDDENYKNRQLHISRKSNCCAAYSENYQQKFNEQIDCEFKQCKQVENAINFDKFLPSYVIQSCLPQMPTTQPTLRNVNLDPDEPETRLEPQFCGNPWKLQRKVYKDGIEQRTDQEEQQFEDMMLTKVDQETKSSTKNRRKGFMKLKDIRECNHKQVYNHEEPQTMDIEEQQNQNQSKSNSKTIKIKFNPIYQVIIQGIKAKNKLNVLAKLNNSVSKNN